MVTYVTLVIRKIDERKLREFKAEAIRRGLTLSQALEEAIDAWLRDRVLGTDVDENNRAYFKMRDRLNSYKGKYMVFANGRFLGAFDAIEEVGEALRSVSPRPRHAIVLKVGKDKVAEGRLEWWGGSIELRGA